MAMTPELRPDTLTGTLLWAVVPSPSCPAEFLPQHLTPPLLVTAHVWFSPTETDCTPLPRPLTSTGVALPLPQHVTTPAVVKAHTEVSPTLTCATPVNPGTGSGTGLHDMLSAQVGGRRTESFPSTC